MAEDGVSIRIPNHVWEGDGQVEQMFLKLATLGKLVDDAERRIMKETPEAKRWLEKLIEMQDKVEEWGDNYRITSHKQKINLHHHLDEEDEEAASKTKIKVRSFIQSLCSRLKTIFDLFKGGDDSGSKTKALSDKLDTLLKEATTSNFFASRSWESPPPVSASASTCSLIENSLMVLGTRDNELEHLLSHIIPPLESSSSSSNKKNWNDGINFKVVSILGKPGMGKTRLAQLVYGDDKVKQYFEVRRWVKIADDFDEERIANALLGNGAIRDSGLWSGSLSQVIKDYFSRKKFLVVMDNVWKVNLSIWELFRDSLKHCAPGSIILVTTSREDLVGSIGADSMTHPLSLLNCDESWSLLKHTSLSGRSHEFSKKVEEIGKRIAGECRGLPFDIKIIGSHLQFKDTVEEWEQVQQSGIWKRQFTDDIGFSALSISYNDLPLQLQRCFLYLAVFPIGSDINVEKLIRLWMAQGYLGPPSLPTDDKRMEMKGMEYFKILAMRSFFHKFIKSSVHKDKIISFQMPDIVHRFAAREISGSATTSSLLGKIKVHIYFELKEDLLFTKMRHIRALDLSSCQLRQLSTEVGNLILLQFLNLSGNPLKQLPETICDLHYLQFLDLHFCYMLSHLPQRIGDLEQLSHLRINQTTDELQQMLQGLEILTSIRTLDVFRVGGRYNSLAKLEKLNDLEEISIGIHGINGLEDPKLERKTHMQNLEVSFAGEGRDVEVVRIINEFRPPPNLEMLKFEGCPGFKLPKWLEAESVIRTLKRLSIRSALDLLSLPAALSELSSLEFLWLYDIPNLKHLGREFFGLPMPKIEMENGKQFIKPAAYDDKEIIAFQSLKTLRIEYLENWRTWEDLNGDDEKHIKKISVMPHLEELIIHGSPKLKTLPHLILGRISSLEKKVTN